MIRKIIAYHLLFIFLLCTFQVGVATHICCGKVVETKIFAGTGSASCGMEDESKKDCENNETNFEKQCCKNLISKFHFAQDFNSIFSKLIVDCDFLKITANNYCLVQFTKQTAVEKSIRLKPPPELSVTKESLPLLQVFRI